MARSGKSDTPTSLPAAAISSTHGLRPEDQQTYRERTPRPLVQTPWPIQPRSQQVPVVRSRQRVPPREPARPLAQRSQPGQTLDLDNAHIAEDAPASPRAHVRTRRPTPVPEPSVGTADTPSLWWGVHLACSLEVLNAGNAVAQPAQHRPDMPRRGTRRDQLRTGGLKRGHSLHRSKPWLEPARAEPQPVRSASASMGQRPVDDAARVAVIVTTGGRRIFRAGAPRTGRGPPQRCTTRASSLTSRSAVVLLDAGCLTMVAAVSSSMSVL